MIVQPSVVEIAGWCFWNVGDENSAQKIMEKRPSESRVLRKNGYHIVDVDVGVVSR
jgi:hypothetical protein